MSSTSDSACRPTTTTHVLSEYRDSGKQPEGRRSSKYDIYGSALKPFGKSYRRSLVEAEQFSASEQEREDSPIETDSVEDETMGCSATKAEVALNEETVKGSFVNKEMPAASQAKAGNYVTAGTISEFKGADIRTTINNNVYTLKIKPEGMSDYEIIYGDTKKNTTSNNNGYSTTELYSEVKKPEKTEKTSDDKQEKTLNPREKLMQEIRDRKDNSKEKKEPDTFTQNDKTNSSTAKIEKKSGEEKAIRNKCEKEEENKIISNQIQEDKIANTNVTNTPISFVEEEYSYEPEKKEATSKLVVRSRSMMNLDHTSLNTSNCCTLKRPNTLKMTTKPDGSIRYGLKTSSSESDLLDDDTDESTPVGSETKSNYVNSIKTAFDTASESQNRNKMDRAEAFDGLRQYFQDNKHGLQELLINNNVVIIEPFRPDPPRSPSEKSDTSSQRTCRITGATVKSPVVDQSKVMPSAYTLPRRNAKSQDTKQGFYHPIKVNKELIDAELPDPEKVRNARELFEKVFKSKSTSEVPMKKPPSKSFFNTLAGKFRVTPQVKVIKEGKEVSNDQRRQGRFLFDQVMREEPKRYPLQRRWTDSGSLSSGVSSDFSCDQDCDYNHHDASGSGSSQDVLEEYSSDYEDGEYVYPYDEDDGHPVSSEVLQKIRACGTTVTYYGGKIISKSHGQFRNPMTMAIMDEIRQNGGTSEGRKKFESDADQHSLGVKFRLVKSNSCGSRLEIAGTDEDCSQKLFSSRHESFIGESIAEEVVEAKEEEPPKVIKEEKEVEEEPPTSTEEEEDKAEADRYVTNVEVNGAKNPQVMTWAELKLKEARKQWHCTPEAVRLPPQDMEFETFEVLDESTPRKAEKNETGRG